MITYRLVILLILLFASVLAVYGWRWIADNANLPLVTMGGNKARGFPLGAAGVYQAVEAAMQLRGEAGENQIKGAKAAAIQAMGGPASNVITHILARA